MRISDWSSDVCSSDLSPDIILSATTGSDFIKHKQIGIDKRMMHITLLALAAVPRLSDCAQIARYRRVSNAHAALRCSSSRSAREMRLACPNLPEHPKTDRKSVVWGKGGAVRVK